MKRAAGQELADRCHQVVIRRGPAWPRPLALSHAGWAAVAIKSRARHAPEARDALQAVDLVRGGRDLPAHRLDLRRAKGRCVSKPSIFASRSSAVIVSSPTLACSRPNAASRASAGRLFSDASPPARNWPPLRAAPAGAGALVAPAAQIGGGPPELARLQFQILPPHQPQQRVLPA